MRFSFDGYTLDSDTRELRRGRERIALEPQVFDVLLYLIEQRHRVVTKDDLIASVWGGRIVSESTLTSRINAARKAIGDSGEAQRFIRTIPARVFALLARLRRERLPRKRSRPRQQTRCGSTFSSAPRRTAFASLTRRWAKDVRCSGPDTG